MLFKILAFSSLNNDSYHRLLKASFTIDKKKRMMDMQETNYKNGFAESKEYPSKYKKDIYM